VLFIAKKWDIIKNEMSTAKEFIINQNTTCSEFAKMLSEKFDIEAENI